MPRQDQQTHSDQADVIKSDPVPVPPPPDDPDQSRNADRQERDRAEFHEPAPQPTVFGAPTVGGAVAASAMASGNPVDERDPREEDTAGLGDGVAEDQPPEAPRPARRGWPGDART
jgi:hypothetical protein